MKLLRPRKPESVGSYNSHDNIRGVGAKPAKENYSISLSGLWNYLHLRPETILFEIKAYAAQNAASHNPQVIKHTHLLMLTIALNIVMDHFSTPTTDEQVSTLKIPRFPRPNPSKPPFPLETLAPDSHHTIFQYLDLLDGILFKLIDSYTYHIIPSSSRRDSLSHSNIFISVEVWTGRMYQARWSSSIKVPT